MYKPYDLFNPFALSVTKTLWSEKRNQPDFITLKWILFQ